LAAILRSAGALLLVAASWNATAGPQRINFGNLFADPVGSTNNEDWTDSTDDTIAVANAPALVDLLNLPGGVPNIPELQGTPAPFSGGLHIGLETYSSFCVSENGQMWFGQSTCTAPDALGPVFNVLANDAFESVDTNAATNPGAVSVSLGLVDRNVGDGVSRADGTATLRVFWNQVGDFSEQFQAILFDLGNGDFDLEFNYAALYSVGTGIQSIFIPGLEPFVPDPRLGNSATDPIFSFRDGKLGGTTSVPEPGTLLLLSTALIGLAVSHSARRRRTVSLAS
jgi:hypothetical protein